MKHLLFLLLTLSLVKLEKEIYIGRAENKSNTYAFNIAKAFNLAVDYINEFSNVTSFDGEKITFRVANYYFDNTQNPLNVFNDMLNDSRNISLYTAPLQEIHAFAFANITDTKEYVVLSSINSWTNFTNMFQYTFSFGIPSTEYFAEILITLENLGAKKYVIFNTNDANSQSIYNGIITVMNQLNVSSNDIYVKNIIFDPNYLRTKVSEFNDTEKMEYRNLAKYLTEIEPDVVIWTPAIPLGPIALVLELNNTGTEYFPKNILSYGFLNNIEPEDLILAAYITNVYWIPNQIFQIPYNENGYESYKDLIDINLFADLYYNKTGVPKPFVLLGVARQEALCAIAYAEAFRNAKLFNSPYIAVKLARLSIPTSEGNYYWDANHLQKRQPNVVQVGPNGYYNLILPIEYSNSSLIYPIPSFNDRVESIGFKKDEFIIFAFISFCIAGVLGFQIFMIVKRKLKVFQMISIPVTTITNLGAILILAGVFTWTFNDISTIQCILRVVFIDIGVVLMFSSLFLKIYRIYYYNKYIGLQVCLLKDYHIFLILSIALIIHFGIIIVYIVSAAPYAQKVIGKFPINNYMTCAHNNSNHIETIILIILLCLNGLLGIFGVFLAYSIRKIKFKIFNESRIIGVCIYNSFFVFVVVTILEFSTQHAIEVYYARSFIIMIGTFGTIVIYNIHKIMLWENPKRKMSSNDDPTSSADWKKLAFKWRDKAMIYKSKLREIRKEIQKEDEDKK